MRYKVNEIFYSLQGEGYYSGTPAVFIRLSGCNLRCPFCDTQHNEGKFYETSEIIKEAENVSEGKRPPLAVITGGEPTIAPIEELCEALSQVFPTIAIESNGTHQPPRGGYFLTVSPKEDFVDGAKVAVTECDELKLVYTGENDPGKWLTKVRAKHYFLQPCDTGEENKNREILQGCLAYIKSHPLWRLSLQTQKIINVR